MRPIDKTLFTTNQIEYNPYGLAKSDLLAAIGNFCSYCEREGFSSALDVEHIQDKDTNPDLTYLWSNFLIACKNCNSIKGTQIINFANILLPHSSNTFGAFEYLESGLIKVHDNLDEDLKPKAEEIIRLVGLDRRPGHQRYSSKDDRWQERKQAWELATKYLQKFIELRCDSETIVDLALKTGFWSIWMSVFYDQMEVLRDLINNFVGTNTSYFNDILD
jgi:uncharacterized protein (TIGR02646 family)